MNIDLTYTFSDVANGGKTPFSACLNTVFDTETADKIVSTLKALQVEIPASKNEFMRATEGVLLFSNRYGVVIRIESKEPLTYSNASRVSDEPFMLEPLGSFEAGNAIIEICPGCHAHDNDCDDTVLIQSVLKRRGLYFWDEGTPGNLGLLPLKTDAYPDGIPIIIDRLAVSRLTAAVNTTKELLAHLGFDGDPQETLYGGLRRSMSDAWQTGQAAPDAAKMQSFWALCAQETRKGTLIAGWNEGREGNYKKRDAREIAKEYDTNIKKKFRQLQFT